MKFILRTLILMLLVVQAHAQCIPLTKVHGDTTYGTLGVTDTFYGGVTSGGAPPAPCSIPPFISFKISNGKMFFKFTKPVFEIKLDAYGMDNVETLSVYLNGVHHLISTTELIANTNCGSASNPPVRLIPAGLGDLNAPDPSSVPFPEVAYNGGSIDLKTCDGFDSLGVEVYSMSTGVAFDICIDTTRPLYCLFAHASPNPLCEGDTLHLWATGDSSGGTATYKWYGPSGYTKARKWDDRPNITLADAGKYHVVRTVGTVNDTDTVTVFVKPAPHVKISTNSPLCYGLVNIINLNAAPYTVPETFSWTGPNSFASTSRSNSITPVVDADTGFYKVVANLNGCIDSDIAHVVYAPIPAAPLIIGDTFYCTGEPFTGFTVIGGPGSSILWYNVGVGGTGSSTAPTISTATPSVTDVWATQTILGCESPRAIKTVTVNTTPAAPTFTGATSYCQYDTYLAPSVSGVDTLFYTTPAGGSGSKIPPPVNTALVSTTTFYATQTVAGCESPRTSFSVKVNPKPSLPIIIDNPSTYCPGQAFVPFTIVSGINILWYTAPSGGPGSPTSPLLSTLVPGVQTVYASQTVLGCESFRQPVSITVIKGVSSAFTFDIHYGCKEDTVVFHNKSVNTDYYTWKFGDGFSSVLDSPTHIYKIAAIDTVKLYSSLSSCIDSSTFPIDLRHPLHAHFTVDTNLICQGGVVTFSDTSTIGLGSVGKDSTRFWMFGDNILHPPVTDQQTMHKYPLSGVFNSYLVITDSRHCTDTMFRTIMVDTISDVFTALTDTVICQGHNITMRADYAKMGNTRLVWDLGNQDSIANTNPLVYGYDQPGVFRVDTRAYYRVCPNAFTSRTVTVVAEPHISIGSDATICKGSESFSLSDNLNAANPAAKWEWSTGETTSAITIVAPGTYTATVGIHGCYASATVVVSNDCYLNIPNAFTPNDDGFNDYFYPHQYLATGLSEFKMSIFNRWGIKVFETTSLNGRGWDGKMNDLPQPEGVYVYLVDAVFKDGQHERHQGNVTLLR